MFPARVYAGQIIVVFVIVIVAIRRASRWAAAALGYQAALGPTWFALLGFSVYLPWRLFEWWYACAWQIKLVTARRWAKVKEIVAAGLCKPKGVFLGVPRGDAYLRHDGPQHVMRVAPTRSGKGSCFADGSGPDLVGDHARHHGRELAVHHEMAVDVLPFACCSIRSIRTARGTTRCSKCAGLSDRIVVEVVYGAMRRSLSS